MEAMNQLQVKLHRAQAEIEESIGHLTKQRALIADRLADGADVTQSCRPTCHSRRYSFYPCSAPRRTRRKLDGALAGKNRRMIG